MRIILTHIPRTGGTTLFAALCAAHTKARAVEFNSLSQVATISDKELNSYEIISTYVGSNIFQRLQGEWTKIVILRDPISRIKSSYWNLRNSSEGRLFAASPAKSLSFREYLASRDNAVIYQTTNVQTWTVLGDRSIAFREGHVDLPEREICELTFRRLGRYEFVGFTEHLELLWQRLCECFGWGAIKLPYLRKSETPVIFDEASAEDLAFHTSLDFELIKHAHLSEGILTT